MHELLGQFHDTANACWVIDAGGNVVGLADLGGVADTARGDASSPYGVVLTADRLHADASMH